MGDSSTITTTVTTIPEWKRRALTKRQHVMTNIPPEWRLDAAVLASPPKNTLHYLRTSGILSESELAITETTSAATLLSSIADRSLSAVQVTSAFSKRAAIAQQLIGCCTEMFFAQALARAAQLDQHLATTGSTIGPLHGLPISFKDLLSVEGIDTTEGWVGQIDQPAKEHSPLVALLIQQGAVPYVKTNISQSIMMADSYNHIFGQSLHPLNRELISGGSSGGEGALLGCRGSVIGFGTDTGGSVRIPSHIQGLYGLAPTVGRLAFEDSGRRKFIAPPVVGPIASSLETMEVVLKGYFGAEPWTVDPVVMPIPWRADIAAKPEPGKKLRIGYYVDDGTVLPQPPITATVKRVIGLLKQAGHEVVEWSTTEHAELFAAWAKAIMGDGGKYANDSCKVSGEPLIEGMIVGTETDLLSIEEAEDLASLRVKHQKKYLKRWRESGVDALITPLSPFVGLRPRVWVKSEQYVGYTSIWNWLGFGALACPAGVVDEENSRAGEEWTEHKPRNESERWNRELYEPELVMGMPVGFEIIGGRFGEEKAISVAKVVEELLAADNKAKATK